MPHLSDLRLAALGDDLPTPAEASHLGMCAACARERGAYLSLVAMAHTSRGTIAPPLTRWEDVCAGLADSTSSPERDARGGAPRNPRWLRQAAAAVVICLGSAALGRLSAGATLLPERLVVAAPAAASVQPVRRAMPETNAFASLADARIAQERSRRVMEDAAAYLAQHDSGGGDGSPVVYRSQLAALDQVISTTREAMRDTPHDPAINDYYQTTIGQREATLRQLNTVLPASLRLNSF